MRIEPQTAREKYERLMRDAATFETYSNPDTYAGPTFWAEIDTVTRRAIGLSCIGGPLDAEEKIYSFDEHPELRAALSDAYGHYKQQIWVKAAALLRMRAASMKEELQKEAAELSALADSLGRTLP